ncbi:hypothetical protein [Actinomyces oricola]
MTPSTKIRAVRITVPLLLLLLIGWAVAVDPRPSAFVGCVALISYALWLIITWVSALVSGRPRTDRYRS